MSIKKIKPTRKSGFKQGYYKPKNIDKYVGPMPIIYRSSWEKKFCKWCDLNPAVVNWTSEPFKIRYYNILDRKFHNYYPDFYYTIDREGVIESYIVEIKPKSQLVKPTPPKRKTKKSMRNYKYAYETFVKNFCKQEALKKFAENRGAKVQLLTEDSNIF